MPVRQTLHPAGPAGVLRIPYGASKSLLAPFLIDLSVNPGTASPSTIDLKGPAGFAPPIQIAGEEEVGDIQGTLLAGASAAQVRLEQLRGGDPVSGWAYESNPARVLDKGAAGKTLAKAAETASAKPVFTLVGVKSTSGNFGPGALLVMAAPTGGSGAETFADNSNVFAIEALGPTDAQITGYYLGKTDDGEVTPAAASEYGAANPAFWALVAASQAWAVVKPTKIIEWRGSVSSIAPNLQTTQDDIAVTFTPEQTPTVKYRVAPAGNDSLVLS